MSAIKTYTSTLVLSGVLSSSGLETQSLDVPSGAGGVSFDVRIAPRGGSSVSVGLVLRGGNVRSGTMPDLGYEAPDSFSNTTVAQGTLISVAAEMMYLKLELSVTGGDADVEVWAVARGAPSLGQAYTA